MLVTLVAVLCNSQICLEKVVTNSDQSSISMMDCQVHAQAGTGHNRADVYTAALTPNSWQEARGRGNQLLFGASRVV